MARGVIMVTARPMPNSPLGAPAAALLGRFQRDLSSPLHQCRRREGRIASSASLLDALAACRAPGVLRARSDCRAAAASTSVLSA
jgi:regulator of sirC expression with transglutaminase-like and TPR domain